MDSILSSYLSVSGLGKGCSGAAAYRAVESPFSPQSSGNRQPSAIYWSLCVSSVWVVHIQVSSPSHWAVHFLWFRQHLLYISVNPIFHFVHIHLKLYTWGGGWSRHHCINALCLSKKLCWHHLYFKRLNFKSIETSAPVVQFLMFDHQKLSLDAICPTIDLQQSLCIYFLVPVVLTISHKPKPQQS